MKGGGGMKGLWNGDKKALNDSGSTLTGDENRYILEGNREALKGDGEMWKSDIKALKDKEKVFKLMEMH